MSLRTQLLQLLPIVTALSAASQATAQTEAARFPWDAPAPNPKSESKPEVAKAQATKPKSAAPPAAAKPAPNASSAEATRPAANAEQRLQQIEAVLDEAGLLREEGAPSAAKAPPNSDNAQRAAELKTELEKLEQQEQSLNAAIAGGLDATAVAGTLESIRTRRTAIEVQLQQLQAESPPPPASTKPGLLERLEQLEHELQNSQKQLAQLREAQNARATQAATAAPKTSAASTAATNPVPPEPNAGTASSTPAAPTSTSGYKDGFILRSEDGNFTLQPNGFVQVRFAYEGFEGADDKVAFSLPRARAGMKGVVFSPALKYNFLADFGKGTTQLTYFYGDYTFSKDVFALRTGLFKRPFTRALLNASEKSEFVSSPLTLKAFGEAHDIGVMVHNGTPELEYAFGVFNGTGSQGTIGGTVQVDPMTGTGKVLEGDLNNVPARLHPLIVGRVGYNDGDVQGYSEGDFEGGPTRFAIGAAGELDLDVDDDQTSFARGTLDAVVKAYGLSAGAAFIISSRQAGADFATRAHDATGLLTQLGYMLTEHVQPALRYTLIAPAGTAPTHEFAAGANLYFHKHAVKWQNELNLRQSEVDGTTHLDSALMSQLQVVF
jgi:hypothetical protein